MTDRKPTYEELVSEVTRLKVAKSNAEAEVASYRLGERVRSQAKSAGITSEEVLGDVVLRAQSAMRLGEEGPVDRTSGVRVDIPTWIERLREEAPHFWSSAEEETVEGMTMDQYRAWREGQGLGKRKSWT